MLRRVRCGALAALSLALPLSACGESGTSPGEEDPGPPGGASAFVPGELVIRLADGIDPEDVEEHHAIALQRSLAPQVWVGEVSAGEEEARARDLQEAEDVDFAEPNWIRTLGANSDPCHGCAVEQAPFLGLKWDLWNTGEIRSGDGEVLAETGAEGAHLGWLPVFETLGPRYRGEAVVGVVDTGVRASHRDLAGRVRAEADFHRGDGGPADDHGHGTHVAGIIGAPAGNGSGLAGVAYFPGLRILSARACGRLAFQGIDLGYGCTSAAVAEGIRWSVDRGAAVLVLGMGGAEPSAVEREALEHALASGTLPVCAAGDHATAPHFPARNPECLAVSATDWGDEVTSYSNRGEAVELAAPGGDFQEGAGYSRIFSTLHESDDGYGFLAGTAMAAAQVAGLAAFIHSAGITGPEVIRRHLAETAEPLDGGAADALGHGRASLDSALAGVEAGPDGPGDDPAISLRVEGERERGLHKADLAWSGATTAHVAIFRDGQRVATRENDPDGENTWREDIDERGPGSYTYQVCEADDAGEVGGICSEEVTIEF